MSLTQTQIDKFTEELKSMLRVETKSRKIKKVDHGFYKNLVEVLNSLKFEADGYLHSNDITGYIRVNQRIKSIESDFRAFFEKRFEKIAVLSIYDIGLDLIDLLTPEERDFLTKLHNGMQDEFNRILQKTEELKPETPVAPAIEKKPDDRIKGVAVPEIRNVENKDSDLIPVRIIQDQPPIAQPDRNYYLRENDIIYLRDNFAELLIKRGAAVKINI
ncbi:MAG: hypothetical protein QW597_03695 [Thermoplasmataceae archaeon]